MDSTRHEEVVMHGDRYRVTYAPDGRVLGVQQQIVPLRYAIHWRVLHPLSRAWAQAVILADARRLRPPDPS